jgi:comEA protein
MPRQSKGILINQLTKGGKKMRIKRILTVFVVVMAVVALVHAVPAEEATKIDLNKASVEDLLKIKGIGESYAQRIIEYRETNGQFNQIEDIMKVKGIGPKLFESIKDKITVNVKSPEKQ